MKILIQLSAKKFIFNTYLEFKKAIKNGRITYNLPTTRENALNFQRSKGTMRFRRVICSPHFITSESSFQYCVS